MKKISYIVSFLFSITLSAQKYVDVGGSGTACTLGSPCSLTYAFANMAAGDTWYVKAGNYGALQLTTTAAGTSGSPIKFIGYTTTPGDIVATNGSTFDYDDWKANGNDLPDNIMPHLELNPTNNNPGTLDDAFEIDHAYVEIHNFMISEYMIGVDVDAPNVTVNNVIGDQFGNWDPNSVGWNQGSSFANENNNGYGMNFNNGSSVTNCTITNNLIINAGHVSYFFVGGGNHTINNNVGVAHDTGNGSDYIFDFYTSSNNVGDNNTAIRYGTTVGHRSRALMFQAQSDFNVMTNFTSENVRVQIENSDSNIINGLMMYTANGGTGENDGSIQIYSQSDNNIIANFEMSGGGGISFLGEGSQGENTEFPQNNSGINNFFVNGKISGLGNLSGTAPISFHRLGDSGDGGTNYFVGVTIDDFNWLVNANRSGTVYLYNCSISGGRNASIDTFYPGFTDATGSYTLNLISCNFFGNNFATPSGTDISTGNPLLDANLNPQSGSALIDSGMDARTISTDADVDAAVALDIDGGVRTLPYDIGAKEFGSTPGGGGNPDPTPKSTILKRRRLYNSIYH